MDVNPEIEPGVLGTLFIFIANVEGKLLPHVLFAVTDILPVLELVVTVMELVEEVPVQPKGKTHE
jgi:hypothetical protein